MVKRGGQPLMAVVQAHGRVFTPLLLEDPFRGLEEVLERLRHVTPVIGTHTHVQTADE